MTRISRVKCARGLEIVEKEKEKERGGMQVTDEKHFPQKFARRDTRCSSNDVVRERGYLLADPPVVVGQVCAQTNHSLGLQRLL